MLLSPEKINLSSIEQDHLYDILCTQKPRTLDCPQVGKAIKLLVNSDEKMREISLKDRHVCLGHALDILANKGDKKNNSHGLRHFSFWSSNNIEKRNLCKEFNKNTFDDFPHDITHRVLDGQSHFIVDYFNYYKEHENNFYDAIKLFNYEEIVDSLNNSQEYFPRIELTKDNTSVIVIPLKFDPHISFCCFYIKDIFYTPFVSKTLFKKLIEVIRQRINLINEINIKNMLDEMMAASFKYSKSTEYFMEICNILKKCNEAEDCLIYLKDDADTRFFLVSEEDENNTKTIQDSNEQFDGYEFYLPGKYKSSKLVYDSIFRALQTGTSICGYPESKDPFTSVCVIIIKDANSSLCGFILLVNKHHKTYDSSLFFNELFFYNNIYIAESCSKYILLYLSILHSNNRKTKLLKKLRHEIPECTHVIDRDISEISTSNDSPTYRIDNNLFQRKAKEISINSRRIDNIASFFSTIDFDDVRFLENPHRFNMRNFIKERIDLFREEAAFNGVYVKYDVGKDTPILHVSDYYIHAVTNIISNAVRYAVPGTCIWIRSNSNMITVSDIGIGISDSEKEMIFKEGYRSVSAKNVSQQGMGYGLYLVKRILDAYRHDIDVSCVQVSNRNNYAERMVSKIISQFSPGKRERYVMTDALPQEEDEVKKRVSMIKKSESIIPPRYRSFINDDKVSTKHWFDYHRQFGPTFFIMEEEFFNQPVYNVTFSIYFSR